MYISTKGLVHCNSCPNIISLMSSLMVHVLIVSLSNYPMHADVTIQNSNYSPRRLEQYRYKHVYVYLMVQMSTQNVMMYIYLFAVAINRCIIIIIFVA